MQQLGVIALGALVACVAVLSLAAWPTRSLGETVLDKALRGVWLKVPVAARRTFETLSVTMGLLIIGASGNFVWSLASGPKRTFVAALGFTTLLALDVCVCYGVVVFIRSRLPAPDVRRVPDAHVPGIRKAVEAIVIMVSDAGRVGLEKLAQKTTTKIDRDNCGEIVDALCEDVECRETKWITSFASIKGCKPLKYIGLLCTNESKASAEAIKKVFTSDAVQNNAITVNISQPVDFNDLDTTAKEVRNLVRHCNEEMQIASEHILVDFTGGTKVVSLAALLATVDDGDLRLQYTNMNWSNRLNYFLYEVDYRRHKI